jgi:C4-type Zn-finger protein
MTADAHRCPRCGVAEVEEQHAAREVRRVLWQVVHCRRCSFTWRTTEPDETLDPARRPALFQLDPERLDTLRDQLPRV